MPHDYTITSAEIQHDHVERQDFIDVHIDVLLDNEKISEKRFAFGMGEDSDAIRAELNRFAGTLDKDAAIKASNAQYEADQQQALETIADLTS